MHLILICEWINKVRFFFRFIFIILFALIIDSITVESLGYILEDLFSIPEEEMLNAIYWGDTFISRIFVSLLGTFIGGYIIGASLHKKEKLATFIYAFPILCIWIVALISYYYVSELPHNFDNPKFSMFSKWKLIPLITFILTLPAAYLGSRYGSLNRGKYTRTYSILNIKLYNLIWFIPTFYSFGVAVISMLIVCIFYSFWIGDNPLSATFQLFSQNQFIIELLSIICLSLILMASISIFKTIYLYISDEFTRVRLKFLKIFGGTIYLRILFVFTFNLPNIISLSFKTDSLATKAANVIALVPKDFSSGINLSIILFSAYITEKSAVKLLKKNHLIKTFFEVINIRRKKIIRNFLKNNNN